MTAYKVRPRRTFLPVIIAFVMILIYFCVFLNKTTQLQYIVCYVFLALGLLAAFCQLSYTLFEYISVDGSQMIYHRPFRRSRIYSINDVSNIATINHSNQKGTFEFTVYVNYKKAFTFTAWHDNYERLLSDLENRAVSRY